MHVGEVINERQLGLPGFNTIEAPLWAIGVALLSIGSMTKSSH